MNDYLLQELKVFVMNGYHSAKQAHAEIFSEKKDISLAIGYLAIANSQINSAKAVYVCNEDLSRLEFDDFFHEFSSFSEEVMECIRTNWSHQWSDIHFNRFEEKYQAVSLLLGIVQ